MEQCWPSGTPFLISMKVLKNWQVLGLDPSAGGWLRL